MTLYVMARDNLSVEDLEQILAEKRKKSQPKPLTKAEIRDKMYEEFLLGGDKPKLYPPRYK